MSVRSRQLASVAADPEHLGAEIGSSRATPGGGTCVTIPPSLASPQAAVRGTLRCEVKALNGPPRPPEFSARPRFVRVFPEKDKMPTGAIGPDTDKGRRAADPRRGISDLRGRIARHGLEWPMPYSLDLAACAWPNSA